jgi:protein-L-isoaspartate(D-aspartate) O-methyltransferase
MTWAGAGGGAPEDLVRAARAAGVGDRRVLEALGRVRREGFVPEGLRDHAYRDRPVPIAHGQVTTQPSLVGRMVAALRLGGGERVLEVGTGLGYQAAVLAALLPAGHVWTLERFADLAAQARANLAAAGAGNVTVVVGDGTLGWPERAPYQAIVVAAAAPRVPAPLAGQLAEGGRLVQPLGPGGNELVTLLRKRDGRLREERVLVPAYFVRLVGTHGLPEPPEEPQLRSR